jgi:hypothetical protein
VGSQGAVAFAEAAGRQEKQLAVKFFFSDDAFKREAVIASVKVRPPLCRTLMLLVLEIDKSSLWRTRVQFHRAH